MISIHKSHFICYGFLDRCYSVICHFLFWFLQYSCYCFKLCFWLILVYTPYNFPSWFIKDHPEYKTLQSVISFAFFLLSSINVIYFISTYHMNHTLHSLLQLLIIISSFTYDFHGIFILWVPIIISWGFALPSLIISFHEKFFL